MRFIAVLITAALGLAAAQPVSTAKKKSVPAKTSGKTVRRSAPTAKTGTKSKKAVAARRPPLQQQPTADRYKEIQQALAEKGYFRGTADGAWSADSVDALKRFQKDQNLDPDGKIGALSLIALGLGPKRVAKSEQPPP